MGTTPASPPRAVIVWAVPTALIGVLLAWAVSTPDGPEPSSVVRVFADLLGSLVLGLALLGILPIGRQVPVWRPIAAAAAAWTIAEVALLVMAAAEVGGGSVATLTAAAFASFLQNISVGQIGVTTAVCTAAVTVLGVFATRSAERWSTVLVVVLSGFALVSRPITGHMSQQTAGSLLAAAHALAAAVWIGLLAAMALTLRTKSDWAAVLPRYSRIAGWCVAALVVTGIANALVHFWTDDGTVTALWTTGYGRIVVAKTVAVVLLVAGGWRLRRIWVSRIGDHRTDAAVSGRHAVVEVAVMAMAYGLAAALATTP